MKKLLLPLAALAIVGSVASWAVDYDLSSLGSTSSTGRYISSLTVSDDAGNPSATIGSARTGSGAIYWDLSAQSFTTNPGATLTITKSGSGSWMHTYFYVDLEGDGFNYNLNPDEYVDPETHKLLPGVDLLWFNVFSPNDTNWYDCEGNTLGTSNAEVPGSFTVKLPEDMATGEYRARIKIAWSSLDPNGKCDVDSKNTIIGNGGQIIDFTIKVEEAGETPVEPVDPNEPVYNYVERPTAWSIINYDSQEPAEKEGSKQQGLVEYVIDDDVTTFWHTQWSGGKPTCPHFFVVDLGEETAFDAAEFFARICADNINYNGVPRAYQIYTSTTDDFSTATKENCTTYGTPALEGTLSVMKSTSEKVYFDETQHARYVMVVITASTGLGANVEGDNIFAAFAEFKLLVKEGNEEPAEPAEEFTSGNFYVINKANGKYLGVDAYQASVLETENLCTISANATAGAFSFSIGQHPNGGGQHHLACSTGGRFSVGDETPVYIYKVTINDGEYLTAEKVSSINKVDDYILLGKCSKNTNYYALSGELYSAGSSSQRIEQGGEFSAVDESISVAANNSIIWNFGAPEEVEPVEPVEPTDGYTSGTFYVINQTNSKYLGVDSYQASLLEEANNCEITANAANAGAFSFSIGKHPNGGAQHHLACSTGGRFSVGDETAVYIYKVTSKGGETIDAEKVDSFNKDDEYVFLVRCSKNTNYYALSGELYSAGSSSQRIEQGGEFASIEDAISFTPTVASVIWKFAQEGDEPTVEPEPTVNYYTFASYNRGGYLTSNGIGQKLSHVDITTAAVWEVTPVEGADNGYTIKNYADGNYLSAAGATVTPNELTVYILPNGVNDFGVALCASASFAYNCIDANNNNTNCGNWQPSASDWQGTTWVQTLIELEEGQTIEEYLEAEANKAQIAEVQAMIDALKAELENYGASIPGAEGEFDEMLTTIEGLDAAELYTMFDGDLDTIQEYFDATSESAATIATAVANELGGKYVIVRNIRRTNNGKLPYLAYIAGEPATINTIADATAEEAIWQIVDLGEGKFTMRNVSSDTYFQPITSWYQTNLAPVTAIEEAGTFAIEASNGYVQFCGGIYTESGVDYPYYYCVDGGTSNLASWIKDAGCNWALTLANYSEPSELPAQGAAVVVPAGTSSAYQTIRFDDAILGDHTGCVGDIKGDADGRSRIFTYNVWMKPTTGGIAMGIMPTIFSNNASTVRVQISGGKLLFEGREQQTDKNGGYPAVEPTYYSNDIELNEWVFLSIVADQEAHTVSLYKDCVLAAQYDTDFGIGLLPDTPSEVFYIGDMGFGFEFEQAQVWTKALTVAELKQCYDMTTPTEAPEGLVAFYAAENGESFVNHGTETDVVANLENGHTINYGWYNGYGTDSYAAIVANEETGHIHPTVEVIFNQPLNPNFTMVLMKGGKEIVDPLLFAEVSVAHEGFPVEHFEVEANGTTTEVAEDAVFGLDAKKVTISAALPMYNVTVDHNTAHVSVEVLDHNGEAAEAHQHGSNVTVKLTKLVDDCTIVKVLDGETDITAQVVEAGEAESHDYELTFEGITAHKALTIETTGTVGLEAISADEAAAKCYDLLGRRVAAPSKGIYVINGQKVVVK